MQLDSNSISIGSGGAKQNNYNLYSKSLLFVAGAEYKVRVSDDAIVFSLATPLESGKTRKAKRFDSCYVGFSFNTELPIGRFIIDEDSTPDCITIYFEQSNPAI